RPKFTALRTSEGAVSPSCQSGRAPSASFTVEKARRNAMNAVASKISRSDRPAARKLSTSSDAVAFGFFATFRAQAARAVSRDVICSDVVPCKTAVAVAGSEAAASFLPHANEQYESPSPDAVAHTRTSISRWDNEQLFISSIRNAAND